MCQTLVQQQNRPESPFLHPNYNKVDDFKCYRSTAIGRAIGRGITFFSVSGRPPISVTITERSNNGGGVCQETISGKSHGERPSTKP